MQEDLIAPIDSAIVLGYFLVVLIMGLVLSRRTKTGSDFFLAGNRLGWAAIGFSLFASNISSSTLIGLTGQSYLTGISISNYEWMGTLILIFISIFVIPFYLRNKIKTVPEFLELRFSEFCRKYYSATTVILTLLVDIASALFAGAIVINLFYPQISVAEGCFLVALMAGLYTAAGGLAAVVYTDILQAAFLLIGTAVLLFSSLGQFDFSWDTAIASVPPDHLSLIQPIDDPILPWLGTLIGLPVLGFYYWGTNQYVVQRILGAKSEQAAKWGALLGGALKLGMLFLIVFPGVFASTIFPDVVDADMIFPEMITELLPPGVLGLVLAGFLAAIMSSVDSALSASSALIVLDFIQPARPHLSDRQLGTYGKATTLVIMLIAGLWAPNIQYFEGLFNYLQLVLSYAVPPVVVVFIAGFFWSSSSAKAAKFTLMLGHIISLLVLILDLKGFIDIHFTVMAGLLTIITGVLFIVLTQRFPRDGRDLTNLTYAKLVRESLNRKEWYLDYRTFALALAVLTMLIVIAYW